MVTHAFPRMEGDVSGASIWRLAEALVVRGHSVSVVAPSDHGDVGAPTLGKVQVRRVRYASAERETLAYRGILPPLASNPIDLALYGRMVWALARGTMDEVNATGAHIIHAHWWLPAGLAVRLADRTGRPFVTTLHGSDIAAARRVPGGKRMMHWVLRSSRTVTAVTTPLAAEAAKVLGLARTDIPVTPMPLALGVTAHPDSAREGAVFIGPLTRPKRLVALLDALALLKKQNRPVDLTIVGDGPELATLRARAIALGLNVNFVGYVAPDQFGEYLWNKRVFVLPSAEEEVGMGVAEALTNGVPVVASRAGGVPDLLVDHDAGILVGEPEPQALAAAIREVISDERFKVGALRAGRILADKLSPERIAEQFEEIYSRTRTSRLRVSQPAA